MAQFRHPWGGFALWDIIMPLFIFMCGAAIPFALTRRLDENAQPLVMALAESAVIVVALCLWRRAKGK